MIFNNKYDRGKNNRKVKVAIMENKLFWDNLNSYDTVNRKWFYDPLFYDPSKNSWYPLSNPK